MEITDNDKPEAQGSAFAARLIAHSHKKYQI